MSKPTAKPPAASTRWVSFDGLRWAVGQMARQDLSDGAKLVLFALASHISDDAGTCWPSIDRIAAMTGRSRQGAKNAIDALAEAGLLTVVHRQDDGRTMTNAYRLSDGFGEGLELGPRGPSQASGGGQNLAPKYSTTEDPVHTHGDSPDLLGDRTLGTLMRQAWEANRGALPEWRVVTPAQHAKIRARVQELPIAEWPKVVQALARSRWCIDKRLGPEFLLRPQTWPRALSGEIERWGQKASDPADRIAAGMTGRQALKRRIDASGGDDHLAEALRLGQEEDGGL